MLLARRWTEQQGLDYNYLGIDIREAVVDRANRWARSIGQGGRVAFVLANATISIKSLFASYPGGLELATIQYPDPQFRRDEGSKGIGNDPDRDLVRPQFVRRASCSVLASRAASHTGPCSQDGRRELAEVLPKGRHVYVQSDVVEIARQIFERFLTCAAGLVCRPFPPNQHGNRLASEPDDRYGEGHFALSERQHGPRFLEVRTPSPAGAGSEPGREVNWRQDPKLADRSEFPWLEENILGCPTEREIYTRETGRFGGKSWRFLLERL